MAALKARYNASLRAGRGTSGRMDLRSGIHAGLFRAPPRGEISKGRGAQLNLEKQQSLQSW